jgi:hypothetical protein
MNSIGRVFSSEDDTDRTYVLHILDSGGCFLGTGLDRREPVGVGTALPVPLPLDDVDTVRDPGLGVGIGAGIGGTTHWLNGNFNTIQPIQVLDHASVELL